MNRNGDVIEIDLTRLARALWRKSWAVVLAMLFCGTLALGHTLLFVTPMYQANSLIYVNSSDSSSGNTKASISQGELNAAQALVDTYIVILNTRTTLESVIAQTKVPYSWEQLSEMILAEAVNGTEVFRVEVTSPDPGEAMEIANAVARILPEKITQIIDGTSARIVEKAMMPEKAATPDLRIRALTGMLLGAVLSCAVIVIPVFRDDRIHRGEELADRYDLPLLAVIPDLTARGTASGIHTPLYERKTKRRG